MWARGAPADSSELLPGPVYYIREPVVVERQGRPLAVAISPDQYAILQKELERTWQAVQQVRESNGEKAPEEVLRDVTQAAEVVRQGRRGKRTKTSQGGG